MILMHVPDNTVTGFFVLGNIEKDPIEVVLDTFFLNLPADEF